MGLTPTQRRTLSRRAADRSLEVEHLLTVAVVGDATDAAIVRELAEKHGWPHSGRQGRSRVVPFGRWAEVVCRFLEDGPTGLVRLAVESPEAEEFCVSVLEEVRTTGCVSALLEIAGPLVERPVDDIRRAVRVADGLNRMLSFKSGPTVPQVVERRARLFLHQLLGAELVEEQRATAVCALRGVGDAESLAVIAGLPPFGGAWAGVGRAAVKHIRQRLRGE